MRIVTILTQGHKRMRRILLMVGIAILMIVGLSVAGLTNQGSSVYAAEEDGVTEDGFYYCTYTDEFSGKSGYAIYDYSNAESVVTVPSDIDGVPVIAVVGVGFKENTTVTEITLPETVETVSCDVFRNCTGLKKLHLGALKYILPGSYRAEELLFDCSSLETLSFGEGADIEVTNDNDPFSLGHVNIWNNLKHISISSTMNNVSQRFFYGKSLETIQVAEGHQKFKSIDNILYTADGKTLLVCGTGYQNAHCVIPEGVTEIAAPGFEACYNIETLTIPESVTNIQPAFKDTDMVLYVTAGSAGQKYAEENSMGYCYYNTDGELCVPVTQLTIDQAMAELTEGATLQLTAVCSPTDASDQGIEWSSSDTAVASVSDSGVITAHAEGVATITARATGSYNVSASCIVNVRDLMSFVEQDDSAASTFEDDESASDEVIKTQAADFGLKKIMSLKLKSPKKKKMTVRWKRDKNATGYQITYAMDKKFKKSKKSVTIKKNKTVKKTIGKLKSGKTYYVKVRAYKKVDGVKIYGPYSSVRIVKVK